MPFAATCTMIRGKPRYSWSDVPSPMINTPRSRAVRESTLPVSVKGIACFRSTLRVLPVGSNRWIRNCFSHSERFAKGFSGKIHRDFSSDAAGVRASGL